MVLDEAPRHGERVAPAADPVLGVLPVTLGRVGNPREGAGVRGQLAADRGVDARSTLQPTMGERSFAEDVKQLGYGAGEILRGEGILAITKALLQSGVSYVGGYPGAPVSYLIDVLADANEPLLKPLGIYFEQSGSEAAAAALLGASINYPMRGAVTWKSVVGTNVASDALSHVASAGVIGGSGLGVGEDYGEGALILQERTHSTALRSSIPLLDPRNSLDTFARFVEEGFGLSEACNEPVFFSIRIRACHMRGTLRCRDNVRPAISMFSPLTAPSFSLDRINLPPFTYQMEAQKFEKRLPAARRYIAERRLNEHLRGDEDHLGIVMQGGLWNTTLRGLHVLGLADTRGRTPVPLLVLNAIHPLVPEELIDFLRGKRRVLVVEEGMPNYIERELKALAHEARLGVEIQGKDLLSPHGEYVPHLVIAGLRRFFTSAGGKAQSTGAIEDRYPALTAHRENAGAVLPEPVAKRPPSFCTGCPERPVFSALKILRRHEPLLMTIPAALRGLGVKWIRTVDSYRIAEVIATLREALTTRVPGLKVVIARNECMLERQRRERPRVRQRAAAGQQVVQPRFGVDPDVCTGDHSCMRLNGCPSLTLRENPDPLREDPIAHVDETCVGCGVCGEVAHAAVLCPSFYEVKVIANPTRWTRLASRVRQAVILRLAALTSWPPRRP